MARQTRFTAMPSTNYPDLRKWGLELELQAKRCKWEDSDWEAAARDVLIYQCPDEVLRAKIVRDKAMFHQALQ